MHMEVLAIFMTSQSILPEDQSRTEGVQTQPGRRRVSHSFV